MARSKLTAPANDLISDSGGILWSFIKGEQLEFPITMNFIKDVTLGYIFEAVVVEADNVVGQTDQPTTVKSGGVQAHMVVRVPIYRGTWNATSAYNKEDVILYSGVYYRLAAGTGRVSSTLPTADPNWIVTTLNKVYVQFPATLINSWSVQPGINYAVYGFFELRVTEPTDPIFSRTWKPVRGMVEVMFSPTDIVPDL